MGCGRSVPVAEYVVSDVHSEPDVQSARVGDAPVSSTREEADTAEERVRKREDEMAKKAQSKDPARDAARAEQRAAAEEEMRLAEEMESGLEHAGQAGWGLGESGMSMRPRQSKTARSGSYKEDEEDEEEDEDTWRPGAGVNRARLRQVGGGAGGTRTRRNPPDLRSGYVIARIRGEVAEDMAWDEGPPEPTSATAEIPQWSKIWARG